MFKVNSKLTQSEKKHLSIFAEIWTLFLLVPARGMLYTVVRKKSFINNNNDSSLLFAMTPLKLTQNDPVVTSNYKNLVLSQNYFKSNQLLLSKISIIT